jgi:predicted dehydrogenase
MKHTTALIGYGRISFKYIEAFVKNADRMILTAACDPVLSRAEEKA